MTMAISACMFSFTQGKGNAETTLSFRESRFPAALRRASKGARASTEDERALLDL
jgi:hypothetical protein